MASLAKWATAYALLGRDIDESPPDLWEQIVLANHAWQDKAVRLERALRQAAAR